MSIAFVQAIPGWGAPANTSPATSGSFTANASDAILVVAADVDNSNQTLTVTGTGSYTVVNPPGTFNDVDFCTWQTAVNAAASSGAQTISIASGDAQNYGFGVAMEYSGVVGVSAAENSQASPGTGAGAVVGVSVLVPVGSVLVAMTTNVRSASRHPTVATGTLRGSGNVGYVGGTQVAYCIAEYAGTGVNIQPSFTTDPAGGADPHTTVQFLLSPSAPATIVVVQHLATPVNAQNVSSQSSSLPANVTAGNALVDLLAYLDASGSAAFPALATDSTSALYTVDVQNPSRTNDSATIFSTLNSPGGAITVTNTQSSFAAPATGQFTAQLVEVFGIGSPAYGSSGVAGASTGPVQVSTSAAVNVGDIVFACCEVNALVSGFAVPAGWTTLGCLTSFPSAAFAYFIATATGVLTANFGTISVATNWTAVIVAYPAAGAPYVPWSIGLNTGVLSGTPNAAGTQMVTVYSRDSVGALASKVFAIPVS